MSELDEISAGGRARGLHVTASFHVIAQLDLHPSTMRNKGHSFNPGNNVISR